MITVISFILVLGFLVFVHELGHYLAARYVGVKVLTFSIGFPPKIISKKVGDTEYTLSWLPLGGYVRLLGQNLDDEDPTDPQNYASKSIRERFYILMGGPAMNLLLAFMLMPMVYLLGVNMPKYLGEPVVVASVAAESVASQVGFQKEDEVVAINGQPIQSWNQFFEQLQGAQTAEVDVIREGQSLLLQVPMQDVRKNGGLGLSPYVAPVIGSFSEGSAAQKAGLQVGDEILKLGGQSVQQWSDIPAALKASQPIASDGKDPDSVAIDVEVLRQGQTVVVSLIPKYDSNDQAYRIGIMVEYVRQYFGLVESIQKGTARLAQVTGSIWQFFTRMFSGQGSLDDMGGPLRIAQVVGQAAQDSFSELLFLTAVISLQLGIFNLLPLPVLDGGHILFLGIEKLKGSALSANVRERVQVVGVALLITLTLAITYNDVLHIFF